MPPQLLRHGGYERRWRVRLRGSARVPYAAQGMMRSADGTAGVQWIRRAARRGGAARHDQPCVTGGRLDQTVNYHRD